MKFYINSKLKICSKVSCSREGFICKFRFVLLDIDATEISIIKSISPSPLKRWISIVFPFQRLHFKYSAGAIPTTDFIYTYIETHQDAYHMRSSLTLGVPICTLPIPPSIILNMKFSILGSRITTFRCIFTDARALHTYQTTSDAATYAARTRLWLFYICSTRTNDAQRLKIYTLKLNIQTRECDCNP